MNPIIRKHFDVLEARLIESPVIVSYQMLRREIAAAEGKLRVKAILSDGGSIELFEYVAESGRHIRLLKYNFHWQDAQGRLRQRWYNAPHYPDLPNAPHHVHGENNSVQEVMQVHDVFFLNVARNNFDSP
ncbi:MAG: DUF6516 family protein [Deltaproteobacteria bacterium]|jgi:hypothetical protein|nr:DUF6516 family protein [Deltaproteobacteria bacterium]